MIGSLSQSLTLRDRFTPVHPERPAPSSSVENALPSRQTAALLPTDLKPIGLETGEQTNQEVPGPGQDQSRLADEAQTNADKASAYFKQVNTNLEFIVAEQTGRVIIKVVDTETREVVRQIPPETLQRLTERTNEMRGLLFEATG